MSHDVFMNYSKGGNKTCRIKDVGRCCSYKKRSHSVRCTTLRRGQDPKQFKLHFVFTMNLNVAHVNSDSVFVCARLPSHETSKIKTASCQNK